jgi:SMC interacting uncharacterized protein involved in chromosome segregation
MRDVVKECNEVIGQQQKLIITLEDKVFNLESVINRQQQTVDDLHSELATAYEVEQELREYIDTLLDHNQLLADTTVKTAKTLEEVGLFMITVSDLVKTTSALGKKVLELCE